jgi:hypothetical protein
MALGGRKKKPRSTLPEPGRARKTFAVQGKGQPQRAEKIVKGIQLFFNNSVLSECTQERYRFQGFEE